MIKCIPPRSEYLDVYMQSTMIGYKSVFEVWGNIILLYSKKWENTFTVFVFTNLKPDENNRFKAPKLLQYVNTF